MTEKVIDTIRNEWISKDKVWKLLGFFSSLRLQQDWKAAESNPDILKNAEWDYFIERMRQYYKPFCNCKKNRVAEEFAIRDQIVIGTINEVIREKAMLKNWNLQELRQNGMKYESAAAGEQRISGGVINKISPYMLWKDMESPFEVKVEQKPCVNETLAGNGE